MPYVGVGAVQTGIILLAARYLFDVPFAGSLSLLLASVALFIVANLALGFYLFHLGLNHKCKPCN